MNAHLSLRNGAFRGVRCKGMDQDAKECRTKIGVSHHSADQVGKVDTEIPEPIKCVRCGNSILYSPSELEYFTEVDVMARLGTRSTGDPNVIGSLLL